MPSSSANGRVVTFATDLHELGSERSVYTVRMDGSDLSRLTETGDDLAPHFAGELGR